MRRVAVLRAGLVAVCLALAVAGCGGHGHRAAAARRTVVAPHLLGRHRCRDAPGFMCATLIVPVDHAAGDASGTLRLPVGVQDVAAAPHGDLLFLTGGPGQGGVDFLTRVSTRLRSALAGYRLVMFDQRGTGATALQCPALQAAAGASDLAIVAHGTVAACARALGPRRRFYTTSETVADIDELRAVLGVRRLTLDGVSYGTFVAERYALAYPRQVARLVLDSVVPHAGVDPLYLASIQAVARVLRAVCAAQRCGFDPVADLAAVVASDRNGPEVLNALVGDSVGNPEFTGVPAAIHAARLGHPAALRGFLAAVDRGEAAPAGELSQGLHESTLCLDLAAPWDAGAPMAARAAALARDAAALPERAFYPFDRATAVGNGIAGVASSGRRRPLRHPCPSTPRRGCRLSRCCCSQEAATSRPRSRGLARSTRRRRTARSSSSRAPGTRSSCVPSTPPLARSSGRSCTVDRTSGRFSADCCQATAADPKP